MQERAYKLMKIWCDTLLSYQVSSPHALLDRALLCPACHVIHGRIADLAFPLSLLYVREGDKRYLDAADALIDWTERNLSRPDGSWRNDAGSEWKGISAFSAMAIGEALLRYGDRMPSDIREKWMKLFVRLSDYLTHFFATVKPVINYYAGVACEQALAWKLTGEERYRQTAKEAEQICRAHFYENGLLCGEKTPIDLITPKGAHPIDMGYNIEESLPLLLRCADFLGQDQDFYRERYRDHMEFMLPDGAIDNSWGSRHNKWTWWGSRTSDGALSGLAQVADEPLFADLCERVLSLYERCTRDGLLSLPMASEAGEPTCLHHSFCHAKALAMLADAAPIQPMRTTLPCETNYGIKFFQNGNLALVSYQGWRATISAIDLVYSEGCENSGGSMTLLVKNGEPICAATTHIYKPTEPLNMQDLRRSDQTPCMTPRLVFENGNDNVTQMTVKLEKISEHSLRAVGEDWQITYSFGEQVTISIKSDKKARFILPIIKRGEVHTFDGKVTIGDVTVSASGIVCNPSACGFHQVGGQIWQPLEIPIDREAVITLKKES